MIRLIFGLNPLILSLNPLLFDLNPLLSNLNPFFEISKDDSDKKKAQYLTITIQSGISKSNSQGEGLSLPVNESPSTSAVSTHARSLSPDKANVTKKDMVDKSQGGIDFSKDESDRENAQSLIITV